MHFHIAHTIFLTTWFRIQGVPMDNLAPLHHFYHSGYLSTGISVLELR